MKTHTILFSATLVNSMIEIVFDLFNVERLRLTDVVSAAINLSTTTDSFLFLNFERVR